MADLIHHPSHYGTGRFSCECIDITQHMTFLAGNAFKYVFRHREKNGVEDLRKAAVYLRWARADHAMAWLDGRSALVQDLVAIHVAAPLHATGHEPVVYRALVQIGMYSDFEGALGVVEQAIAQYEQEEPVAA